MANLSPVTNEFQVAFDTWFEGCKKVISSYNSWMTYDSREELCYTVKQKYIFVFQKRIVPIGERGFDGSSAWAFVDIKTGDVLKPASWKAPAKHARGNIFDKSNGLGSIGPYGPAYLRG